MRVHYRKRDMDSLLAADRFPVFAERAARRAIAGALAAGRVTPRSLVNEALLSFERAVSSAAPDGVRPTLLFAERDRIVTELGLFLRSRLAARIFAVRRRDLVAIGRSAAPFDAVVRGHRAELYAVALRRLPLGAGRLEAFHRIREAARLWQTHRLRGVLVYDLGSGHVTRLSIARGSRGVAA